MRRKTESPLLETASALLTPQIAQALQTEAEQIVSRLTPNELPVQQLKHVTPNHALLAFVGLELARRDNPGSGLAKRGHRYTSIIREIKQSVETTKTLTDITIYSASKQPSA